MDTRSAIIKAGVGREKTDKPTLKGKTSIEKLCVFEYLRVRGVSVRACVCVHVRARAA